MVKSQTRRHVQRRRKTQRRRQRGGGLQNLLKSAYNTCTGAFCSRRGREPAPEQSGSLTMAATGSGTNNIAPPTGTNNIPPSTGRVSRPGSRNIPTFRDTGYPVPRALADDQLINYIIGVGKGFITPPSFEYTVAVRQELKDRISRGVLVPPPGFEAYYK